MQDDKSNADRGDRLIDPSDPIVVPTRASLGAGHEQLNKAASELASPTASRIDFLWKVHDYTNSYIRFADGKAAIAFASTTGLLSWISANFAKFTEIQQEGCLLTLMLWGSVCCLAIGSILTAGVLIPRLWTKPQKGLIFWEQISHHENGLAYGTFVSGTDKSGLELAVADHIHILARIASRKYALVAYGIVSAALGCALLAWPGFRILSER